MNKHANDQQTLKMLVRTRDDFQQMRKCNDNRLGVKADGDEINDTKATRRAINVEDAEMIKAMSDELRRQESECEKKMMKVLKRFPIYTEWLSGVKGVGAVSAAWIISEIDIYRAENVSKIWQFCGLNSGMKEGKRRVENKDGTFSHVPSGEMIRGDKLTPGFVAPFNKRLRVALLGVMCDGFIKQQNEYAMRCYYPYKHRLENSDNTVMEIRKAGSKAQAVAWKDAKKAHRHRAAMRFMLKQFLVDLYVQWRTLEGLPVRAPYHEEKLGHKHAA